MSSLLKSIVIPYVTVAFIAATSVGFAEETSSTKHAEVKLPFTQISPDGLITVIAANTTMDIIVSQISDRTTATVRARGTAMQNRVTYIIKEQTLDQALTKVVDSMPGLILYQPADEPNTYEIWDQESYRREVLPQCARPKVFLPKHIQAEEVVIAIEDLVTPGIGSLAYDARSNKVFVTDLPQVIEQITALIEQIDVSLVTRVFFVAHADVEDLAAQLDTLRSDESPEIIADTRTRQIIVKDRLDLIAEMDLLVKTLDISTASGGKEL